MITVSLEFFFMEGHIYSFEINKGKDNKAALRKLEEVWIALLGGNNLDINDIFAKVDQ